MNVLTAGLVAVSLLAGPTVESASAAQSTGPTPGQRAGSHRSRVRPSLQKQIDRAIDRALQSLVETRLGNGKRRSRKITDAPGAGLIVYAAMHAGIDRDDRGFVDALAAVRKKVPTGTYERACSILALAKADAHEYEGHIDRIAERLAASQESGGGWGYPGNEDLSNTQYAALALWTAARHGVKVHPKVWVHLADALPEYAHTDGGLTYRRGQGNPTLSMTAAGAACASICLDRLDADEAARKHLTPEREQSLRLIEARAIEWMADQYGPSEPFAPTGHGWPLYAMYGVERAAAFVGETHLGERDWYADGALYLVANQRPDGSWGGSSGNEVSTAFGILFLVRATQRSTAPPVSGPRAVLVHDDGPALRRRDLGRNRMHLAEPSFSTSGADRKHDAPLVADLRFDTWWQSRADDPQPLLRLDFASPQEVDTIAIAHPRPTDPTDLDLAHELDLRLNGGTAQRLVMPPTRTEHGRLKLEEPISLERLEIRIRSRRPESAESPKPSDASQDEPPPPPRATGIGEVLLVAPSRSRTR